MTSFLLVLLALSVLIEGTITVVPLTLICLICFTIFKRDTSVFPYAFGAGLLIDIFRIQPIGGTSIFYIGFLFLILLYKKKYEIYSSPFVLLSTFLGAFFYLQIIGYDNTILIAGLSAIIALILFLLLRSFSNENTAKHEIGLWNYGKNS